MAIPLNKVKTGEAISFLMFDFESNGWGSLHLIDRGFVMTGTF